MTAEKYGLEANALVEMFAGDGPSVRAWIALDPAVPGECLALDADGLALLGARADDAVALRRIEPERG